MGGSFKSGSNNHGRRGKPYALMLLLAFGAAILGVMVLHKLREKRIFTLLVKEKDHELLTLHLLFEREKEFNKEARNKIEEMKTKMYSLRSQKLELDRRLLEMESTIAAMNDERKVIESALEEKKNEIITLTQRTNSSSMVHPQDAALRETIKKQEAEIENLKLHSVTSLNGQLVSVTTGNNSSAGDTNKEGETTYEVDEANVTNATNIQYDPNNQSVRALNEQGEQKMEDAKNRDEYLRDKVADPQRKQGSVVLDHKANETSTTKGDDIWRKDRSESSEVSDIPQDKEAQGHEFSLKAKRRHSKGKRWRDSMRNRRLGYPHTVRTGNVAGTTGDAGLHMLPYEGSDTKNEKMMPLLDKSDSEAQMNGGQAKKEKAVTEQEEKEQTSFRMRQGTQETEEKDEQDNQMVEEGGRANITTTEDDATKQKTGETGNHVKYQEMNGTTENSNSMGLDKQENGDQVPEKEEAESEDADDNETREPEIDRDDIKRFSEADHEEESEETEF